MNTETTLAPLQQAQARMREMREQGIQIERLDPLQKAQANPKSLRLAINAKCFDCVGRGHDSNWRGAVGQCAITECGLWAARPYQSQSQAESPSDDDVESVAA